MMKKHTQIRKVKFSFRREDLDEDKEFDSEIEFYTTIKSQQAGEKKKYNKRLKSCDPTQMFENLLKIVESKKDNNAKMPVRKFFNNSFDTLLN